MGDGPSQRDELRSIQDSVVRLVTFIIVERGATGVLRGHDVDPLTIRMLDAFDFVALAVCLVYLAIDLLELLIRRIIEAYEQTRGK